MTLMVNRRAAEELLAEHLIELSRRLRERLLEPERVRQALEDFPEFERAWAREVNRIIDEAELEFSRRLREITVESDPA